MLNKAEQGKASGRCRYFNWLEQKADNIFLILYRYCITIEEINILQYYEVFKFMEDLLKKKK